MINLEEEGGEENFLEGSETSDEEKGQVVESRINHPEIGESKVKAFLNTKPIKAFVPEPLFPPFLQRKSASPGDKWPSERLSNIEKTSRIPSQPISARSIQDEKTNLESVPHTRSTREDHFLHQRTIPDSTSPTISVSCLLDGNLNALNGLRKTRQTDDASALKLEHEMRRDDPRCEIGLINLFVLSRTSIELEIYSFLKKKISQHSKKEYLKLLFKFRDELKSSEILEFNQYTFS